MVSIKQFILSSLPALSLAAPAVESTDSPEGSIAVAEFPEGGSHSVSGSVKFSGLKNGSVQVDVDLKGLPSSGGPFLYHIHEAAVPSNGSCAATLAHFNPNHGNATACPSQGNNALCEAGDLSGKHGKIDSTEAKLSYVEPFISLNSKSPYYFADGKRSITVHFANTSRIACANIELAEKGASNSSDNSTTSSVHVSTATDNLGNKVGLSGAAILAAAAALLMWEGIDL